MSILWSVLRDRPSSYRHSRRRIRPGLPATGPAAFIAPGAAGGALLIALALAAFPPAAGARPGSSAAVTPPSPVSAGLLQDGGRVCAESKIAHYQRMATFLQDHASPNQLAYQPVHYGLELHFDLTHHTLAGRASITARVDSLVTSLTHLVLNFQDAMGVDTVLIGSTPVSSGNIHHAGDSLDVTLDRPYLAGENINLVVSYHGRPDSNYVVFQTVYGKPHMYTFSEPWGARAWWPCKDYPDAKPDSVDIRVWVPSGERTASNGRLMQETDDGVTDFTWWHEGHPITPYLVSLAVYPYHVYSDAYHDSLSGVTMPLLFYNFPPDTAQYMPTQAKIKDMLAAYTREYGPYPYLDEKYGQAEFTWPGGEEHQTMSSMGSADESVVAHELTHQWWGDMVTCKNYHEVWINEGFAVYGEALWQEASGGEAAYQNKMGLTEYFGPGTVYRPDDTDFYSIFNVDLAYHKASWVLHMLRHVMGDSTFFRTYKAYYQQYKYRSAGTDDYRRVAEQVWAQDSGRAHDLRPFFREWIYGQGYPYYSYDWTSAPGDSGWSVNLTITQTQTQVADSAFVMPLDVRMNFASGSQTFVVQDSLLSQHFVLHSGQAPQSIDLDPDNWVLRRILGPVGVPTFTRPLLVVNSASWLFETGQELYDAYQNRAFVGNLSFDFWDCAGGPQGPYPWTLPQSLGVGPVPAEVLRQYRTVVWISGYDPTNWLASPVYSYLKNGGNVFLLAGSGPDYVSLPYQRYLGMQFAGPDTVYNCVAQAQGLSNLRLIGPQVSAPEFQVNGGAQTTLLYNAGSANAGLGVVVQPDSGGAYNAHGGRFVFLSGLPYRWNHDDLRANVQAILTRYMPEPLDASAGLRILGAVPNPFHGSAVLRFYLPAAGQARLGVYDVMGRRMRILRDGLSPAGWNDEPWDGKDDGGNAVASGVYFTRLESGGKTVVGKIVGRR